MREQPLQDSVERKIGRSIKYDTRFWRIRFYGIWDENEDFFSVVVVAPTMEEAMATIRKECDECAIFERVVSFTGFVSEACLVAPGVSNVEAAD